MSFQGLFIILFTEKLFNKTHVNDTVLHLHSCRCMKQSECGHRFLCTQVRFLACNQDHLKHFQVMLWPAITQDLKRIIIIDFRTFSILYQVAGDRWLVLVPFDCDSTRPFHFGSIIWCHRFACTWSSRASPRSIVGLAYAPTQATCLIFPWSSSSRS